MKLTPALLSLFLVLFALTGCQESEPEQTPELSFKQRYEAALEREQPLSATGVTNNMVQAIQNVTEEFLPEAAAKVARACGISQTEAEHLIRAEMKRVAIQVHDEYVKEYGGYGTIVRVLAEAEARAVVVDVMESEPAALREKYFEGEE